MTELTENKDDNSQGGIVLASIICQTVVGMAGVICSAVALKHGSAAWALLPVGGSVVIVMIMAWTSTLVPKGQKQSNLS